MSEFNPRRPAQVAEFLQDPAVRRLLQPWIEGNSRLELLSDAPDRGIVYKVSSETVPCVLRFPLDGSQERALWREAIITGQIRDLARIEVPDTTYLHGSEDRPPLAVHRWVAGGPLTTEMYHTLREPAKQQLADDLADFLAAMHGVALGEYARWCETQPDAERLDLSAFGPPGWFDGKMRDLVANLPRDRLGQEVSAAVQTTLVQFEELTVTAQQLVFGHGDVHGFNLAMRATGDTFRLRGIFDFGIAGIIDAHEDFFRLYFISADLVARVLASYTERSRVNDLPGIHPERIELYWRAFLLYLMVECYQAHRDDRFQAYRQILIEHLGCTLTVTNSMEWFQ